MLTHACAHTHTYTHTDAHTFTHTCSHTFTRAHVNTYTCTRTHSHTRAHVHTCTRAFTRTHIHTHTLPARSSGRSLLRPSPALPRTRVHHGKVGVGPAHFAGRLPPKRLPPPPPPAWPSKPPCAITVREGPHSASTRIGVSASLPDTGLVGGVLGSVPSDAGRRSLFSGGSRGSVASLPSRGWGQPWESETSGLQPLLFGEAALQLGPK